MKNKIIALLSVLLTVSLGFIVYTQIQLSSIKAVQENVPQNGIVFENENVSIKYFDVDDGTYDVLVEAKNNTNISSEWEMKEATNYNFTYLVGRKKDEAKKFYDNNLKKLGYRWTWEENYEIEKDGH